MSGIQPDGVYKSRHPSIQVAVQQPPVGDPPGERPHKIHHPAVAHQPGALRVQLGGGFVQFRRFQRKKVQHAGFIGGFIIGGLRRLFGLVERRSEMVQQLKPIGPGLHPVPISGHAGLLLHLCFQRPFVGIGLDRAGQRLVFDHPGRFHQRPGKYRRTGILPFEFPELPLAGQVPQRIVDLGLQGLVKIVPARALLQAVPGAERFTGPVFDSCHADQLFYSSTGGKLSR